jgi:gas vesicle protein
MNVTSMLSVTSFQSSGSSSAVSSASGHHHKHKSMADMVNQMGSAIDDAKDSGKLTGDQADALKKMLAQIMDLLKNNQTASNDSDGSNSVPSLSSDVRQKIKDILKQVSQQFMAALQNAQGDAQASSQANPADQLFSKIDTNGDGTISKGELKDFVSNLQSGNHSQGAQSNAPQTQTYGQQGSFRLTMLSVSQSTFSVSA